MLFIYARELWTLAKWSAMQFLLPYFVYRYAVSHINITFDIYNYIILISVFVNSVKCE